MGIEFRATSPGVGAKLLDDLTTDVIADNHSFVNVVGRPAPHTILLAFTNPSQREPTREDVQVTIEPGSVYVLFHSSTRALRERFLALLSSHARSAGLSCQFTEL